MHHYPSAKLMTNKMMHHANATDQIRQVRFGSNGNGNNQSSDNKQTAITDNENATQINAHLQSPSQRDQSFGVQPADSQASIGLR